MRDLTCKELDAVAGGLDLPTGEAVDLRNLQAYRHAPRFVPPVRAIPIPGEPKPV
jgi:hypothetical protein